MLMYQWSKFCCPNCTCFSDMFTHILKNYVSFYYDYQTLMFEGTLRAVIWGNNKLENKMWSFVLFDT